MKNQITIPPCYIHLLKDTITRDIFIDGLISIAEGIEPKTTNRMHVDDALSDVGRGLFRPRQLKGLPPYGNGNSTTLTPSWTERYENVRKGMMPLNFSASCSVKGLVFTNITTATRHELAQLEKTIRDHFRSNPRTRQIQHWLRYILEVMSFCVRSELLELN